jgi:XTP/dITP diphosphohydrolase
MNKIIIATTNQGKVREFKKLLEPLHYEAVSLAEENITEEIIEDGDTFEENAHIKAKTIHNLTGLPVIADDSGLVVDFLDGAPGIYSARYGGENLTDVQRTQLILDELKGVEHPLRSAHYVCAIYFIRNTGNGNTLEFCVKGVCDGFIGEKFMGEGGFGYDPIFMIDEDTSMAMLTDEEKNKISHRGKALRKLIDKIKG